MVGGQVIQNRKSDETGDSTLELDESFNSSCLKVLPRYYHAGINASFEMAAGQYNIDSYDQLEFYQKNDVNYSPVTPRAVGETNNLKTNSNETTEDITPSKFLQGYLDGSMSLLPNFPLSSSSSRDATKNPTLDFSGSVTTRNYDHGRSNQKTFSKYLKFRLSFSSEELSLESSSQHYADLVAAEMKNNNYNSDIEEGPDKDPQDETEEQSSYLADSTLSTDIFPNFKTSSLNRTTGDDSRIRNHASASPPKEPPVKYNANRPHRSIVRPNNYFEPELNYEVIVLSSSLESSESETESTAKPKRKKIRRNFKKSSAKAKAATAVTAAGNRNFTARSKNGCWTCRLRRKKCPEQKPECSECIRLGLMCDNSEVERPVYMNDKKAARKKMDEIKQITNLRKRVRMKNRSSRLKKKN